MLSEAEKKEILSEFPNIKLSYETIIHKKVHNSQLIFAIPDGKKYFTWFTTHKGRMVCMLLELDSKNKKEIKNIRIIKTCFSCALCYGTIFYGTLFYHMNNPFFSIEDIYMYKGHDISSFDFNYKINKICYILKNEMKQISYNNYFVVFGIPIFATSHEELDKYIHDITYKLYSIKYVNSKSQFLLSFSEYNKNSFEKTDTKPILPILPILPISTHNKSELSNDIKVNKTEPQTITKYEKILLCKPDIQNDIYHLYSLTNEYIGVAGIPDYKTSVMMNKYFRIIKENDNLDALEESDDDEEFENSNIDKFVYLDKSNKIICRFNNKFKKWIPIKILE